MTLFTGEKEFVHDDKRGPKCMIEGKDKEKDLNNKVFLKEN